LSRWGLRGFFYFFWLALDGLRRAIHLVLMLLVLVLVLAVVLARPHKLPESFALVVSPEGMLVEQYSGDAVSRALEAARGIPRFQTLVSHLVEAIEEATDDPRVAAIHLDLSALESGSLDKLGRIAVALQEFSATGRPVIASAADLGVPQYYLAAHADELYLDPLGFVLLQGYGFYRHYFKSAMENLSVDWYVVPAGEAKSFGDPFGRDSMSDAERENLQPIAAGLWTAWRDDVARVRGLEPDLFDDYIERFLPRMRAAQGNTARVALDAGLIDGLMSVAEIEARLVEAGSHDRHGNYVGVHAEDYIAAVRAKAPRRPGRDKQPPAVGLIIARGDILPGDQPPGTIGDESLRELLREAREHDAIRAVVLRVDSGGGSQFASEAIMRDIEAVRAAGKPVLVSMGGVAASGGYMMALPADEVWAHPTTLTGSIGVVAMIPNFGRLLQRLGVNVDGVGTHRYTGDFRLDREFSAEAMQIIELLVEGSYERFLGQVAAARDLSAEEVLALAEGRVWLGDTAFQAGLVDRLGTLDDALAAAADWADMDDYEVVLIEPSLSLSERIMVSLLSGATRFGLNGWPVSLFDRLPVEFRTLFTELERLDGFADPRGLYFHCFCE
jgi:protease IV